ncbi:MAG: DUF1573 domain-containing protein [Candidatus Cloacimonetes bacterium]|nr:DUF1573 domain-containing protein [Candidatus Cloacimonadota bacterium]
MRNTMLVLLLLTVATLVAQPVIQFDKTEHNFGEIKEVDGKVHHDFIFSNKGDKPLKILDVKAGCG